MQHFELQRKIILKYFTLLFALLLCFGCAMAANLDIVRKVDWKKDQKYSFGGAMISPFVTFTNASIQAKKGFLPYYSEVIDLKGNQLQQVTVEILEGEQIDASLVQAPDRISGNQEVTSYQGLAQGLPQLVFTFLPIVRQGSGLLLVKTFVIHIVTTPFNRSFTTFKRGASSSVLAKGDWFKIATTLNGIHRIDYNGLKTIGINPDQIDPRNIQLYGHGAGMLPTPNSVNRIDDLAEISIQVKGEEDGKFNPGDYILFYGESQLDQWAYSKDANRYVHTPNIYSDTTYYFLTIGNSSGKRFAQLASEPSADVDATAYDYLYVYENDRANLIKSGKIWVGEEFDRVTEQTFNITIPNLITSLTNPIQMVSSVTARSYANSSFDVSINGGKVLTQTIGAVAPGYDQAYAFSLVYNSATFNPGSPNFSVTYSYNKPLGGSIGWLDFFELVSRCNLTNSNGNFVFRDMSTVGANKRTRFNINTSRSSITVLDVSNPIAPFVISGTFASGNYSFVAKTDSLREFAVFDGSNFLQPKFIAKVANQNLHNLGVFDGIIISPPDFLSEAERLAAFHRQTDNLRIQVVNVRDIYNEFSSGSQDIAAIRDFLRMLYKRGSGPSDRPKIVMLFGRASYDYKFHQPVNTNFVPTFESQESFQPTGSYCSDDFYAFLDDNEGNWDIGTDAGELMDVGIGRLPVSSLDQAKQMVDKFISYVQSSSLGDWRNRMVFCADDEDQNSHEDQSNRLADNVFNNYHVYNIQKIFLDAYVRQLTSGGARYPDVEVAINNAIEKGCLIFNYTGHGGEVGLTAERVMSVEDIASWANKDKLALFLTATCEFSRFDDPARASAGELVLLNPTGGGIALFTTVRLVFSGQNEILNNKFYAHIGLDSASQLNPPRLGQVMQLTKNDYLDPNTRNFTLLGDPFLKLAYAKLRVATTSINGKQLNIFSDTLKALSKVTITGQITDQSGVPQTGISGTLYPTIFDKQQTYRTLANNPETNTPMDFVMQNNVLYHGKASVDKGQFSFSFIVPKDISYQYGNGKISYYAENQLLDANGFLNSIMIGGTSDTVSADKVGPNLKLFMNDEKFANGGLTDQNPVLVVKLFDENGINTTGRGIGRDLTATLDNDNSKSVVLNDYYQATINSYQSGEVRYAFKNLSPGKHSIRFRAYDTYNNPGEASLDFEIRNATGISVNHLLNYPNPFNNHTLFMFDHNQSGEDMQVSIQIFTVGGKLIKTLNYESVATGNHFDQLTWDGRDEYGDRLANGVYVYKLKVKTPGNKALEQFQKLVILN